MTITNVSVYFKAVLGSSVEFDCIFSSSRVYFTVKLCFKLNMNIQEIASYIEIIYTGLWNAKNLSKNCVLQSFVE